MKSIGAMIQQLEGMLGTDDLSQWESEFVASVAERSAGGALTNRLSEKQVDVVNRIYGKHFGDNA
jgi:hypothetical protein